jgi:predicted small lipoprotein YifL
MPNARRVSRRRALVGAAALAALGATSAACGRSSPEPPQPDPLESQLDLAQRDSQMARSAATAAGPFYAPPLNVVADERAAHAKALSQEISRVAAESTPSSTTTTPTTAPPAPPPSRTDVIAALRESADSAAKLAASQSGYRAGLLGSIAAACTTSITVPLAMTELAP